MPNISVVINTRNEEKDLPRALDSVKNIANEIVVVDMESEDKTVSIAKKYGANIFSHRKTNYVEPARNFAISKAKGEWILILDADEELPQSLVKTLTKLTKSNFDYYRIPRKNIIFGKWIKNSRWWPDYNIRFFKKGFVEWNEVIHSVPFTKGRRGELSADEENAIVHHNYNSLEEYLERMNIYTTEHARLLIKEKYEFVWTDLIKRPMKEFLGRYFFGNGYKDGLHGLSLSLLQAFSELILYLKIWQIKKFEGSSPKLEDVVGVIKDAERELHYWQADSLIKEGGGLLQRIKRKFKL